MRFYRVAAAASHKAVDILAIDLLAETCARDQRQRSNPLRRLIGDRHRDETAHRMSDQMRAPDTAIVEKRDYARRQFVRVACLDRLA
jgi:hypothetical protein